MAVRTHTRRRIEAFQIASSTPRGAGPYEKIFEKIQGEVPFQISGQFGRQIRISLAEKKEKFWLVEAYLILNRVEILEVSEKPVENDDAVFVTPPSDRTFASKTCALFYLEERRCAIEYVKNGPKVFDFEELLSQKLQEITKLRGSHFSITPIIRTNFIRQINSLETIKRVRVSFERPNPGWDDIGLLSQELEGSGDVKREISIAAPRSGSLKKDKGLLAAIKKRIRDKTGNMSDIMVEGREAGEPGNKVISSKKSNLNHTISVPVTDDESIYRRTFLKLVAPFVRDADENA